MQQTNTNTCSYVSLPYDAEIPDYSEFRARWSVLDREGSLDAVDTAITAMLDCFVVEGNLQARSSNEHLDELEWLSFRTVRETQKILALMPTRRTTVHDGSGVLLCRAVRQFLIHMPWSCSTAIMRGTNVASQCRSGLVPLKELSSTERTYREWAFDRLTQHLVFTTCGI